MTTTTTSTSITSAAVNDHDRSRRAVVPVAVATVLLAAFFSVFRSDSIGEMLTMIAFEILVTALFLGLVVPRGLRHDSAGGRALAMGLVGLLLVFPAFWSGLPLSLGVSAVLLGNAGKRAATRSGLSIAALVLGTLSVVGYVAILVADWVMNPGTSWIAQR